MLQNFLVLWNKTKEDFQKEQLIQKENVDGNKKKGEAVLKPVWGFRRQPFRANIEDVRDRNNMIPWTWFSGVESLLSGNPIIREIYLYTTISHLRVSSLKV